MKEDDEVKERSNAYLKYSNIAFQLAALVCISFYLGQFIDKKLGFSTPIFTILLILFGFGGYIYSLYSQLFNPKK